MDDALICCLYLSGNDLRSAHDPILASSPVATPTLAILLCSLYPLICIYVSIIILHSPAVLQSCTSQGCRMLPSNYRRSLDVGSLILVVDSCSCFSSTRNFFMKIQQRIAWTHAACAEHVTCRVCRLSMTLSLSACQVRYSSLRRKTNGNLEIFRTNT